MEESEELTRVAQEITGTEATYGEMQKRLESSLKKAEDGSYEVYEGAGLDDLYDYLAFMEKAKVAGRDIRFSVNGKTYTKEEIDADFANIQEEINAARNNSTPNRATMELDLLKARLAKVGAEEELGGLDAEYAELENRCQEEGKVLPSDNKSLDQKDEEPEK